MKLSLLLFLSSLINICFFKSFIIREIFLLGSIFNSFSIKLYKENEPIVNQLVASNSSNRRIIIVLDGNIKEKDTNNIIAGRNDIIGYDGIYDKEKIISDNYIAKPDLISLECEIDEFSKVIQN